MLILANFIVSFGFKGDMKCEGEKEEVALFKQKVMLESFGPCPTLAVINSSFVTVPFCTLYTLKQVNVIDFGQFSSDTHIQLYIYTTYTQLNIYFIPHASRVSLSAVPFLFIPRLRIIKRVRKHTPGFLQSKLFPRLRFSSWQRKKKRREEEILVWFTAPPRGFTMFFPQRKETFVI